MTGVGWQSESPHIWIFMALALSVGITQREVLFDLPEKRFVLPTAAYGYNGSLRHVKIVDKQRDKSRMFAILYANVCDLSR